MVTPIPLSEKLPSSQLRETIPEKTELCFQYHMCASDCPVVCAIDYIPPQLSHLTFDTDPKELAPRRYLINTMPQVAKEA